MKILNKFFNWILYRNESNLDRNIRTTTRSFWRLDSLLDDDYYSKSGHCCSPCYLGAQWNKINDKQIRVAKWLSILLKKRGSKEDLQFAKYLDSL